MGIAAADYSGDGRPDLLVTNSHQQLHAVFRSKPAAGGTPSFTDARSDIAPAFDTSLAGWGASWVDLDNDTQPRPRDRERRHPGDRAREERRARPGLREPDGARPSRTVRRREQRRRPRTPSLASTAAASPPPTSTTTVTSTSRSTRSTGSCCCSATRERRGTGSRCSSTRSLRVPSSPPSCPTGIASCRRYTPAAATSPPRTRARTSGSVSADDGAGVDRPLSRRPRDTAERGRREPGAVAVGRYGRAERSPLTGAYMPIA